MILRRMFPESEIVGVELEENLLSIAKIRAAHYGFDDIQLFTSRDPNHLPENVGNFDYVIMSAVYEHLLPEERRTLLPEIWGHLQSGGTLFVNQTPFRYFPIETHTTSGLPLINYLPSRLALRCANVLSKRKLTRDNWETLLRKGIRGGSVREIVGILSQCDGRAVLLEPARFGMRDRIDLWYLKTRKNRFLVVKRAFWVWAKLVKALTGVPFLPYLSLAIKKSGGQQPVTQRSSGSRPAGS